MISDGLHFRAVEASMSHAPEWAAIFLDHDVPTEGVIEERIELDDCNKADHCHVRVLYRNRSPMQQYTVLEEFPDANAWPNCTATQMSGRHRVLLLINKSETL